MSFFWLLGLVAFMGVALLSLRRGVILYLISALIFPSLWINDTIVLRVELIYCLWLVFVLFLRKTTLKSNFRWHSILSKYAIFLLIIVLSTMFGLVDRATESSLSSLVFTFYGVLRPLLVMFVLLNTFFDEKFPFQVLQALIWLSIPISLLSIGQSLGLDVAQKITLQGYTSTSRTPVFALLEKIGVIVRSTGVFESPVYNGVFFVAILTIIGVILASEWIGFKHKWVLYLLFSLSIVAGITTLSATFILGTIFALTILLFFFRHRYPKYFLQFTVGVAFIASIFVVSLSFFTQRDTFKGVLTYQINRVISGVFLNTRFDPETGIFKETYKAIQQRPIFGWGFKKLENVFVGDSTYMVLLYWGGIVGLGTFLWIIYSILRNAWRNRNQAGLQGTISWIVFLWTLIFLATSFGSPSFFILRLQEWYWALVGIFLNLCSRTHQNHAVGNSIRRVL